MDFEFNEYKSLRELDVEFWSNVDLDDPELAMLAKRVSTKPVRRLEAAELLALLRRDASLAITVPLALHKLEGEPFLKAATHPGDLLVAAMECDATFWKTNRPLWEELMLQLGEAAAQLERTREAQELSDYYPEFVGEDFMAALLHFKGLHEGR